MMDSTTWSGSPSSKEPGHGRVPQVVIGTLVVLPHVEAPLPFVGDVGLCAHAFTVVLSDRGAVAAALDDRAFSSRALSVGTRVVEEWPLRTGQEIDGGR